MSRQLDDAIILVLFLPARKMGWPAPRARNEHDHMQLCTLMRKEKKLKGLLAKEKRMDEIGEKAMSLLLRYATKHGDAKLMSETLQVPLEPAPAGVKRCRCNLLPTAQLKLSFSGLPLKRQAAEDNIDKGTVAYTRKAVAKAYLEAQQSMLNEATEVTSGDSFSFVVKHMKWDETQQQVSIRGCKRPCQPVVADGFEQSQIGESMAVQATIKGLANMERQIMSAADDTVHPNPCVLPVKEKKKQPRKKLTGLRCLRKKRTQRSRLRGTANVLVQKLSIHMVRLQHWLRFESHVPLLVPPRALQEKSASNLKVTGIDCALICS